MTEFGRKLKQILEDRGISQKWLADAALTKEATISRYITGVNKSPNVEILVNIAKALNVSADYLLTGDIIEKDLLLLSEKLQKLTPSQIRISENVVDECIELFGNH